MTMAAYNVIAASVRHLKPLSQQLRPAACVTLQAFGLNPRRALQRAFFGSSYCRTAMMEGRPAAMWGTHGTALSDHALVWLALGEEVAKYPLAIVRLARAELLVMRDKAGPLYATIASEDSRAAVFARTLGFQPTGDDENGMSLMVFGGDQWASR